MRCDAKICLDAGAPRKVQAQYKLTKDGLSVKALWLEKDAVRSVESMCANFYPRFDKVSYIKIGSKVDPRRVVKNGGRKLSAIEKAVFDLDGMCFAIDNIECALAASDGGDLLNFDNAVADLANKGLSFVLHDNVWGTNFPLWYADNALFNFCIKIEK